MNLPQTIPLWSPEIRGNAWRYAKECLDTNWVSSAGPFVDRFERIVAETVGVRHGVATMNGTSALHMALLIAGVEPDAEVIVPSLTFVACANAVRYCGAWPVFMDADPATWQMDPEKVRDFLTKECQWKEGGLLNRKTGRPIRAILPVHILGHPCDMDPLLELAHQHQLTVIEDAAESLGATYQGRRVGSLGDIACLSFNGNKIITTGGGGMILTNNPTWAERARYLTTQAKDDPEEYVHSEIGYNYRLSNLAAALGCAQMESLLEFIRRKVEIAKAYTEAFSQLPDLSVMPTAVWAQPIYWLFTIRLHGSDPTRGIQFIRHLASRGIQARRLWRPLHRLPMYRENQAYRIEAADGLYEEAVSLPSSVGLQPGDQQRVMESVQEFLKTRSLSLVASK